MRTATSHEPRATSRAGGFSLIEMIVVIAIAGIIAASVAIFMAESAAHFFAIASRFMRRILVDHARARGAVKRGGAELIGAFRRLIENPVMMMV